MSHHSLTFRTGSIAALLGALVLTPPRTCRAESVSAVLDLIPATATENTFDIRVNVLNQEDTQSVIYDGVVRPVMDIDFSNPAAPVVNSLDFTGIVGDIGHDDATFSVPLGTAEFSNITGRIETPAANSPAPVSGGVFSSSDHQLIAWSGTIDVTPFIGGTTTINLNDNTFIGTLSGTDDSAISVALESQAGGTATYNVDITAVLDDVQISTGNAEVDDLIQIFITGNLVASGQFTRAVPEPSTAVLAGCYMLLGFGRRRHRALC